MTFPTNFISASKEYCTFEKHVPAPYLRKNFKADNTIKKAEIIICGLGFYELFVNGKKLTKGALAPYINAPDDILWYDVYDVSKHLICGENVIGIILGNGMHNCFGGYTWNFHLAKWRSAPMVALRLDIIYNNEETISIKSDESFKTASSPIIFDDLRCGEYYDARLEQIGWNLEKFDDSEWKNAIKVLAPRGETKLCTAEPIIISREIAPISITKQNDGYIYDFGENLAGLCRLEIKGKPGQQITMVHGELLVNGKLHLSNLECFEPSGYFQKDIYICNGEPTQKYTPSFTYHGFRYVFISGINDEQATTELLTYLVMHSGVKECGDFTCSDEMANAIQKCVRNSDLSNFYYFPTDCPQREKNGWTGDAQISAEHMLLNLTVENSLSVWLDNIRKSQREDGAIPGIVPTGGWGFDWGNGPAWDAVISHLPYNIYKYHGDKKVLYDNANAIFRYLNYLSTKINEQGLLEFGLGDWCPPDRRSDAYITPLVITDSIVSMDICQKAEFIFDVLNMKLQKEFAHKLSTEIRQNIRKHLVDFDTMTMTDNTQTSQAMALYYNIFEPHEKQAAFESLQQINKNNNNLNYCGILGSKVLFYVLTEFGEVDLAYDMITTKEFPSYGNWIVRGATSLWEGSKRKDSDITSFNHHFFGDVSAWFIKCLAGIDLNPNGDNIKYIYIKPNFPEKLNFVEAYHDSPNGRIESKWNKNGNSIKLCVTIPENVTAFIILPEGYLLRDNNMTHQLLAGTTEVIITKISI